MKRERSATFLWAALLAFAASAVLSLSLGAAAMSPAQLWEAITAGPDSVTGRIFFYSRLPRTCGCLLSGAALAASGCLLQNVLGNQLASPGIIGVNAGWYKVIFQSAIGYIRSDYLDLTEIPYENQASKKSPLFFRNGSSTGVTPSAAALKRPGSLADEIIANAKKYIGVPYLWGGTTPSGFDCSGYVQYIFRQSGITLPRTTTEQYKVGTYVSKANLIPGDLVFLQNTYREGISHVGIYIGDGKMIHAENSSTGVIISDIFSGYYGARYVGARRIV